MNINKKIEIGRHTKLRFAEISSYVRIGNYCNIQRGWINAYTYLGDYCELPQTKIGKFCSVASHVTLAAGNHPIDYLSTSPYTYSRIKWSFTKENCYEEEFYYIDSDKRFLCEIGNDVWIGTGAMLVCGKSALKIGDGAVIVAGAVVTKDVPPYAVVAGCPAKIIRYRFDEKTISDLMELRWWDKDKKWICKNLKCFKTPEDFIVKIRTENDRL